MDRGRQGSRFRSSGRRTCARRRSGPTRATTRLDSSGAGSLNGSRSSPRAEVALHGSALAGPKVENAIQGSSYYSIHADGPRRLSVRTGCGRDKRLGRNIVADLDEVLVTVGETPSDFGGAAGGIAGGFTPAHRPDASRSREQSVRATMDQAAGVFEAIAARSSLYTSFADLSSELVRGSMRSSQRTRSGVSSGARASLRR